jgi:putative oxidoreductase
MKKMIVNFSSWSKVDLALLVARVGIGLMMLTHGVPKMQMLLSGEPIAFADVFGMGVTLSLALAVFSEVFCSILLVLGLVTRLAAIPLIFTMLVAVFHIHADDPFAKKEMGMLYLTVYIVLYLAGGGKYALDRYVFKK